MRCLGAMSWLLCLVVLGCEGSGPGPQGPTPVSVTGGAGTGQDPGAQTRADAGPEFDTGIEADAGLEVNPDAAVDEDAAAVEIDAAVEAPVVPCSTDSWWRGGNRESPLMRPGGDCIGCHTRFREGRPRSGSAGTVMGAVHDEDDCNGIANVEIRLTDADGAVHTMTSNAAGNFYLRNRGERVNPPYTATIFYEGRERSMVTAQMETNCVVCHVRDGANGAPGRIFAP